MAARRFAPNDARHLETIRKQGRSCNRRDPMQRATALIAAAAAFVTTSHTQAQQPPEQFGMKGQPDVEGRPTVDDDGQPVLPPGADEAPTGFDNKTNGFLSQGPAFDTLNAANVVALRSFNDNRFLFEEVEHIEDGLGPIYNAQSCGECHQNVATGGASQIAEHRTGRMKDGVFFESAGGSLVHSRATHPNIVEPINFEDDIRTFRISTNTLGAGFVEAISNSTLLKIRRSNRPRCAARSCSSPFSKPATGRVSAVSAGKISMQASSRSRPMRTSTRWALRARCFPTRIPRTAKKSVTTRTTIPWPIPRTTATTSRHSPTSCARRRLRRAGRSTPTSWLERRSSKTSAATRVTCRRSSRHRPAPRSTAATTQCRRRSAARSSTRTATFWRMTSAQATE